MARDAYGSAYQLSITWQQHNSSSRLKDVPVSANLSGLSSLSLSQSTSEAVASRELGLLILHDLERERERGERERENVEQQFKHALVLKKKIFYPRQALTKPSWAKFLIKSYRTNISIYIYPGSVTFNPNFRPRGLCQGLPGRLDSYDHFSQTFLCLPVLHICTATYSTSKNVDGQRSE